MKNTALIFLEILLILCLTAQVELFTTYDVITFLVGIIQKGKCHDSSLI